MKNLKQWSYLLIYQFLQLYATNLDTISSTGNGRLTFRKHCMSLEPFSSMNETDMVPQVKKGWWPKDPPQNRLSWWWANLKHHVNPFVLFSGRLVLVKFSLCTFSYLIARYAFLQLLFQAQHTGITYEYTMPLEDSQPNYYTLGPWGDCSVTCGQGGFVF